MKGNIHEGAQPTRVGTHGKGANHEEALPPEGHRLSSQKKAGVAQLCVPLSNLIEAIYTETCQKGAHEKGAYHRWMRDAVQIDTGDARL